MNLELFAPEAQANLLPCDGIVEDYGLILRPEQSEKYLQYFLVNLAWQHDQVFLFGQHHITKRQVAGTVMKITSITIQVPLSRHMCGIRHYFV